MTKRTAFMQGVAALGLGCRFKSQLERQTTPQSCSESADAYKLDTMPVRLGRTIRGKWT